MVLLTVWWWNKVQTMHSQNVFNNGVQLLARQNGQRVSINIAPSTTTRFSDEESITKGSI